MSCHAGETEFETENFHVEKGLTLWSGEWYLGTFLNEDTESPFTLLISLTNVTEKLLSQWSADSVQEFTSFECLIIKIFSEGCHFKMLSNAAKGREHSKSPKNREQMNAGHLWVSQWHKYFRRLLAEIEKRACSSEMCIVYLYRSHVLNRQTIESAT